MDADIRTGSSLTSSYVTLERWFAMGDAGSPRSSSSAYLSSSSCSSKLRDDDGLFLLLSISACSQLGRRKFLPRLTKPFRFRSRFLTGTDRSLLNDRGKRRMGASGGFSPSLKLIGNNVEASTRTEPSNASSPSVLCSRTVKTRTSRGHRTGMAIANLWPQSASPSSGFVVGVLPHSPHSRPSQDAEQ